MRFGVSLLPVDTDQRAVTVDRFQLDDGSEQFQKVFADGSRSELLRSDQIDDESRCLADRPPSPRPRYRQRSRKRKAVSQRSSQINRLKNRQRMSAVSSAKLSDAPSRVKTLREFDSAEKARELLATIDADYERTLRDDALNIAAFPTVPSEDRVRASLHSFRQLVSEPNVTLCVCVVCAERRSLDRFRIFLVANNHDSASTSNTLTALPDSLLLAMKSKLVHDPAMPSHLPPLTGGTCSLFSVCTFWI